MRSWSAGCGRLVGWVLDPAFGWATTALFGRLPDRSRAGVLLVMTLAAVWLAAALGILFVDAGVWPQAGPLAPDGHAPAWARPGMAALVATIPVLAGVLSLVLFRQGQRPRGRAALWVLVLGYPLTLGLALTLPLLALFVPLLRLRNVLRRWAGEQLAAEVRPGSYAAVVQAAHDALHDAGLHVTVTAPSALLRLPYALLSLFGRGSLGTLLAERLALLRSDDLEVVVYPSGLVFTSRGPEKAWARAVLARRLAFGDVWLTWSAPARALEERLTAVWRRQSVADGDPAVCDRVLAEVEQVRRDLQTAALVPAEWEVLERLGLLAEVVVLRGAATRAASAMPLLDATRPSRPAALIRCPPTRPGSAAPRTGVSPAAVAATLAAAAVMLWRMSADHARAEA